MESHNRCVTTWAKGFGNMYSLWCVVALAEDDLPDSAILADRYASFMTKVEEINELPPEAAIPAGHDYVLAARYRTNATGASTEEAQRVARYEVLREAMTRP